jgi:hypothetical protein
MISAASKKSCPSVEQLSQFIDLTAPDLGLPEWDVVAQHVKDCAECRQKLSAYQRVDQAVERLALPPEGLAERICAACRDGQARESIQPFPWWRSGWGKVGIAAAVLAFLGLSAVNFSGLGEDDGLLAQAPAASEALAEMAEAEADPATVAASSEALATASNEALYERGRPVGNISSQDLRSVSLGKKAAVPSANAKKYLLPDSVRHVWSVEDLAGSRQRLAEASAAMKAPLSWSNDDEQGRLKAVLRLTDNELQQLVNRLGDGHWALVSPYLPQPNAPDLVQLTGKRLLYEIILVQREK